MTSRRWPPHSAPNDLFGDWQSFPAAIRGVFFEFIFDGGNVWLMLQKSGELFQFGGVQVGGGAEVHAVLLPENEVVSADGLDFGNLRCF